MMSPLSVRALSPGSVRRAGGALRARCFRGRVEAGACILIAWVLIFCCGTAVPLIAQQQKFQHPVSHTQVPLAKQAPAPVERRAPQPALPPSSAAVAEASPLRAAQRNLPPGAHAGRGVPLAQWMNQHSQLSPPEQQHALEREPGFHDLPQTTQDRMRQRLNQLDSMPPAQRQRLLARNEAMEHLAPDQRLQVRGAMQQLGSLPIEQRRSVARTFRQLRDLPPDQRAAALNSDQYRGQFTDTQRSTLDNLLRIEPMLPPPDRTPR